VVAALRQAVVAVASCGAAVSAPHDATAYPG
jgi:hypothetical protein